MIYDRTVDLHGMRSDEAMALVRRILERKTVRSESVRIIHGNGSGILRSRIRGALKSGSLPSREYFFGEDIGAPGLDGVTIVYT